MAEIKITQTKSLIGGKQYQRDTMRSLGLRKIGQSVVREDDEVTMGMVRTVAHLIEVEESDS